MMNYYDENVSTEYVDEFYIPKKDKRKNDELKNNNKKSYKDIKINKKYLIIFIIILLILIIGIFFIMHKKNKPPQESHLLNNIIIDNYTYTPNFDPNIYDYYLLVENEELTIECDTKDNKEVEGCNEKIDLSNYYNYIHQIIVKENEKPKIYNLYIKVKENETEKNISINSIDNLSTTWTNQSQTIKINTSSENKIIAYSFDNGLTWQEDNSYLVEENSLLKVIVQDENGNKSAVRKVDIDKIDKILPTGTIIIDESNKNKIVLKIIGKDDNSGIDGYSWNGKDYSKEGTFEVTKKGEYYVTIKDKAGNISEKITITIKESDFKNKKQYGVSFYKNGSNEISNDYLSCTAINGKCTITLPNIEREGFEIIGWSEDKNSKEAKYKPNEKIDLTKSMTLYAITKKDLIATFDANSATSISSLEEKCPLYNDNRFCYITTPTITSRDGKIIGWNTEKESEVILEGENNLTRLYEDTTYYALAYKKITVTFDLNGADNITSRKEVCRIENGKNTCTITTPTIKRETSSIIGWSTNKNATVAEVSQNSPVEVSKDTTYYAITKKNVIISFDKNGASKISETKASCILINNQDKCHITTPVIYRNDSTVLGWSTNKDSKTGEKQTNTSIEVSKNTTYYAITSKKVYATFELNGADEISSTVESCTLYNASSCKITTPKIRRTSWNVIGWSTNKNATSATFNASATVNITADAKYYAITSKKITVNFYKNTADSLGNCTTKTQSGCVETCNIYNLNESCQVTVPYIYSEGNEVVFFSTGLDPTVEAGYSPANKLNVFNDVELNAIVYNRYRPNTYSISKSKMYGYTIFETESGCSSKVYNNYYTFVDRLYKDVPYLFTAAKVTFSTPESFVEAWNGNYSGMTYGYGLGYRNVDVKCPDTYSDYYLQTIVHELVHAWDSYYMAAYGTYLREMPEIKKLYSKYKSASVRPLRDYAYSSESEFIADAYAWYYFLYINSSNQPKVIKDNLYYPAELKRAIEKYINISKRNYQ